MFKTHTLYSKLWQNKIATTLELEDLPLIIQSPFHIDLMSDSSLGVQCVSSKQIIASLVLER